MRVVSSLIAPGQTRIKISFVLLYPTIECVLKQIRGRYFKILNLCKKKTPVNLRSFPYQGINVKYPTLLSSGY